MASAGRAWGRLSGWVGGWVGGWVMHASRGQGVRKLGGAAADRCTKQERTAPAPANQALPCTQPTGQHLQHRSAGRRHGAPRTRQLLLIDKQGEGACAHGHQLAHEDVLADPRHDVALSVGGGTEQNVVGLLEGGLQYEGRGVREVREGKQARQAGRVQGQARQKGLQLAARSLPPAATEPPTTPCCPPYPHPHTRTWCRGPVSARLIPWRVMAMK